MVVEKRRDAAVHPSSPLINEKIEHMAYDELIRKAIDLHVHVGPEVIPRTYTADTLARAEKGKLRGAAMKNHFFPVTPQTREERGGFLALPSVTLNRFVGGFNADAVRASAELAPGPVMVWFPTVHAENFLKNSEFELPPEWIDPVRKGSVRARRSGEVRGLSVFDGEGKLRKEVREVLEAIKEHGCILATGHIAWQETVALVRAARREFGIDRIIVTHPIYTRIAMPVEVQKELVREGAFMEACYSMYSIDTIPIADIAREIKEVGAEGYVISSDVGQTFSPSPSEALARFAELLSKEGVSDAELEKMLVDNPSELVF